MGDVIIPNTVPGKRTKRSSLLGATGFQTRKEDINRKGPTRSFTALRRLAKQLANEEVFTETGEFIGTRIELILREWFSSPEPRLQIQAVEIAFGKVPLENKPTALFAGLSLEEWQAQRRRNLGHVAEMEVDFREVVYVDGDVTQP